MTNPGHGGNDRGRHISIVRDERQHTPLIGVS